MCPNMHPLTSSTTYICQKTLNLTYLIVTAIGIKNKAFMNYKKVLQKVMNEAIQILQNVSKIFK